MSLDNSKIILSGCAALTPVGLTLAQTGASIRAGVMRFSEHAFFECAGVDPEWDATEALYASSVSTLDPYLDGPERLLALIGPPLRRLFSEAKFKRADITEGAFLLALPQPDESLAPWSLEETFLDSLYARVGLPAFKTHMVNASGHAGMFWLVQEARNLLNSGDVSFCIVGGVDSYLLPDRLAYLDAQWRLKSAKAPDGFVPGEAAVLLLLEKASQAAAHNRPALAEIMACGFAREAQDYASGKNSTGKGLAAAISALREQVGEDVQWPEVLCDLNGEAYRGYEWGIAQTLLHRFSTDIRRLNHPADCVGDVGAATGGLLMALTLSAFQRQYAIADQALLWTSSDDGLRAAMGLGRVNPEDEEG